MYFQLFCHESVTLSNVITNCLVCNCANEIQAMNHLYNGRLTITYIYTYFCVELSSRSNIPLKVIWINVKVTLSVYSGKSLEIKVMQRYISLQGQVDKNSDKFKVTYGVLYGQMIFKVPKSRSILVGLSRVMATLHIKII